MNYYSFHIGDYAAHTRRLDLLEDLAYRRILDEYYLSEKPLLGEPDLIAKLIGMPEYVEAVEYVLNSFFECTPEGYYNKRCEAEISEMQHRSKIAKEKADKRWSEAKIRDKPSHSNAVALPQQSQCNATNTNTNTKDKDISKPDGIDSVIWKDYLKVRNKQKKPMTETALKGLVREAEKAKLPLAEVLQICCERGWVGFKAEWVAQEVQKAKDLPLGTDQQIEEAYRVECGGDPRLAKFGSYFEMKKFILDKREKRATL